MQVDHDSIEPTAETATIESCDDKSGNTLKREREGSSDLDTTPTRKPVGKLSKPDMANIGLGDLLKEIQALREEQTNFRTSITARLENNQKELRHHFDKGQKDLRDYFDIECAKISGRMDKLEQRLREFESGGKPRDKPDDFDTDVSIIAIGMPYEPEEELMPKCQRMVQEGLGLQHIEIVACKRTKPRGDKPGIAMIRFCSVSDKIKVLRAKLKLAENEYFAKTFLKGAKSHAERLIDHNFREILKVVPDSKRFRFTGSGRLLLGEREVEGAPAPIYNGSFGSGNDPPRGRGRGSPRGGRGAGRGVGRGAYTDLS